MDEATRTTFHDALANSTNAAARALADFVIATPNGRPTCWGDLVDYARAHFQTDDDSLALWKVLTDVGDRRPQLLFLDIHRARPSVLRSILADTARVPPIVQCALVAMPEAEPLLATALDGLAPAAREIAAAPRDVRARERVIYDAHVGSLNAQRAGAPFSQDAVLHHLSELPQILGALTRPNTTETPPVPVTHPIGPNVPIAPILEVPQALRPGGPQ
jgi:hypothetical protein